MSAPGATLDDCYERLGEAGIERLVDTFYDAMDQLPEAAGIRAMHAKDLRDSRRKLRLFLVGRFGGPPTYVEERGHPRLRSRHLPFAIGAPEAGQWLTCMKIALDREVADGALRVLLWDFFTHVAAHMVNRGPGET